MSCIKKSPAVVLLVALLGVLLVPAVSHGQGGQSPLMPPQSRAFGRSFQEWNVLQTQLAIETGLGGGTGLSNTVGRVRLLPSAFSPVAEFEVTLPPGTPFVASPVFLFGERYDDPNVPDDDPIALAPVIEEIFANAQITTVLDGKVLLNGTGNELKRFRFGPVYFDEPIVYADPQPRGPDLNAVAALWVTGIGSVYHPLPVGQHTLVITVKSAFLGDFQFTYHITVSPK